MSGCTLAWQLFPNNKGGIPVCIVDIFRRKYSICHGTKWDLVELAIVKKHTADFAFVMEQITIVISTGTIYSPTHPSIHPSIPPPYLSSSFNYPLSPSQPTLTNSPRSHPVTHSPTQLPNTSTHSFTHSPFHHIYSLSHALTHSLTHSFTHPPIHSLTDSLNHSLNTDYNEGNIHEIFQSGVP